MRIAGIIQARMGSKRLPGKVLRNIAGSTIIERIVARMSEVSLIDQLILATTDQDEDDVLCEWSLNKGLDFHRGSVNDVLERTFQCAQRFNADVVVRITADDPLKDPSVTAQIIKHLIDNKELDYCSNTIVPSYPEGLDIEVIRFEALEVAQKLAKVSSDREHVTPFIWRNPSMFRVENIMNNEDLSHWRWTVDYEEDILFMEKILLNFPKGLTVSFDELVGFLKKHPDIVEINHRFRRNEGYYKSLNDEEY